MASLVAIGILVLLAWIVLAAAGLVPSPIPGEWLSPASWIGTGYFVLGGIVNLISRSKVERVWSPVALATAVCYGLVSAS